MFGPRFAFSLIIALLFGGVPTFGEGLPTISSFEDPPGLGYSSYHDDHKKQLGGLNHVDKIVGIEVYGDQRRNYEDNADMKQYSITGLIIMYRMTDGKTQEMKLGYPEYAPLQQEYDLKEGEFLTEISTRQKGPSCTGWECNAWTPSFRSAITGIKFCYSTRQGRHCSPVVGDYDESKAKRHFVENGVIKGLRATKRASRSAIHDRPAKWYGLAQIGGVYEVNKVAEFLLTNYTQQDATWTRENVTISEPDAIQLVNNKLGTSDLEVKLTFSETVETSETSHVSNTQSFSQSSTETMSHEASIKLTHEFSGGILGTGPTTSVELGYSFSYGTSLTQESSESQTVSEQSTTTFTETYVRNYVAQAHAGEIVQVELYYDEIQYDINWTGAVQVCFQADLQNCKSGDDYGLALEGSTFGSQPIPTAEVRAVVLESHQPPEEQLTNDQKLLRLQAKRSVVKDMVQSAGQEINLRGSNNMQTSSEHKDRYSELTSYLDELDTKILELIQEKGVVPEGQD